MLGQCNIIKTYLWLRRRVVENSLLIREEVVGENF